VSFFVCRKGVESMTKSSKKDRHMKPRKGKSEHFTRREIEDLMNVNMPVYRRGKGGAWRNVR
jgi:hypothetical protein